MSTDQKEESDSTSQYDLFQTIVKAYGHLQKFVSSLEEAKQVVDSNPSVLSTKVTNLSDLTRQVENSSQYQFVDKDGVNTLLESFQDDTNTLPIHWASKLGITKMVEHFLSVDSSLLLQRTGTTNQIALHFANESEDTRHALITAHPDYESLCQDVLDCYEEPMDVEDTLKRAIGFGYDSLAKMIMEFLPDYSRKYIRDEEVVDLALEMDDEEGLLLMMEFDPTLAQIRCGMGRLPLFYICESYDYDPEEAESYLLRFLSHTQFYGLFEPDNVAEYLTQTPSWRRHTHWSRLMITGHPLTYRLDLAEKIFNLAAEKNHTLINDAVGKISLENIVTMVSQFDSVNPDTIDDQGRNLLTMAIHRSTQAPDMKSWQEYFKILIIYAFLLQCKLDGNEDRNVGCFLADYCWAASYPTTASSLQKVLAIVSGKQNRHGKYLIHILAEEGILSQHAMDFLHANCADLVRLDGQSRLLPFMLASTERGNVSTAYEMLRMNPSVIEMLRRFYGANNSSNPSNMPKPRQELRFTTGQRVKCLLREGWLDGTIVESWCTWEANESFPYRVTLDEYDEEGDVRMASRSVLVPADRDDIIQMI